MVNIDKKIVAVAVTDKEEPKVETMQKMHEHIKRPDILPGATYKIKTPLSESALYVTINNIVLNAGTTDETVHPFEIFINSKSMTHFQWSVALTRILSAVFRKGGDVTFVVEELKSVFDPNGGYFKKGGRFAPSLVSEIGDVIEQHLISLGLITVDNSLALAAQQMVAEKNTKKDNKLVCEKCGSTSIIVSEGCKVCSTCGWSRCS